MNKQKVSLTQQIQSSSDETLTEKRHTFTGMCYPFAWLNMQILNYVIDDMAYSQPSYISKLELFC